MSLAVRAETKFYVDRRLVLRRLRAMQPDIEVGIRMSTREVRWSEERIYWGFGERLGLPCRGDV
jgi:hypothetical protein